MGFDTRIQRFVANGRPLEVRESEQAPPMQSTQGICGLMRELVFLLI
jgi:hypothetical protein